jgi:hypothetical protein
MSTRVGRREVGRTPGPRAGCALLVVLVTMTALGGCASSPGDYCDVLRSVQADWKGGTAVLQDPAAAARFMTSVTEVEASAPDEVKADWASLRTLVQQFTVANPDLSALTKRMQGFEASAKRIEVHARETCQVDLSR